MNPLGLYSPGACYGICCKSINIDLFLLRNNNIKLSVGRRFIRNSGACDPWGYREVECTNILSNFSYLYRKPWDGKTLKDPYNSTFLVTAGTKVTWTNSSGSIANVSSDPHPIHTNYPPLNLGKFDDGGSVSLVFDKPGTYGYHNHLIPSQTGKVIVE